MVEEDKKGEFGAWCMSESINKEENKYVEKRQTRIRQRFESVKTQYLQPV